jgi:hypothetical protein
MKTLKRWQVCVAATAFWHCPNFFSIEAAAAAAAEPRVVHLAVIEPIRAPATPVGRDTRGAVLDLLTARLSTLEGFAMVERAALEAIFRELSLSAASLSNPAEAVRVGRMLKADWFLFLSFPPETTNTVLVKIVDASTGVIRDLQIVALTPADLGPTVEALTTFVVASKTQAAGLNGRLWIGFGGFEDLGVYRRYRDFGNRLREAMTVKYAGTRVSVVERTQLTPLLEEVRLGVLGLAQTRINPSPAQPAFVLVDGLYQAFQDEQSKINLVLRMEWIGGRRAAITIKELPGLPLEAKVSEAINRFLAEAPVARTNSPTREAEARVQLRRGRDLARMSAKYFIPPDGVISWSIYPRDRAPRVREAISAFESVLFLEPENVEAKFCLAGSLADPVIDELEKARDIWREMIATTTNVAAATAARSALAASYVDRDNLEALQLMTSLRNAITNLAEQAVMNSRLGYVRSRLADDGKLASADILEFAVDAWRTSCRLAESRVAAGGSIDAYMTFSRPESDFYHAFSGAHSTKARQDYIGGVVSNLTREFPRLEPYLVASYARSESASSYWREWHKRTLIACEEHPERILDPASYYNFSLMGDLRSFIARKEYDEADRAARMFENKGRNLLRTQQDKDELDFLIGDLRRRQDRWFEAIEAFERIGPRQVKGVRTDGFWGQAGSISGTRAIEICREHMAMAASRNAPASVAPKTAGPLQLRAPSPVKVLPGSEITFALDDGQLWLGDRVGYYRYQIYSGELENLGAKINPRVRRVLVHRDLIWFATAEGLYAFNPTDRTVVTNTVSNGLLMPSVTALFADGSRMWTGFGGTKEGGNIGGIGYLNISENRFVGLIRVDGQPRDNPAIEKDA